MLRITTLFIAAIAAIGAMAETSLGFSGESAASVGIYVKELSTGKVLAENDAQKALVPASVMKSITAAAALTELGTDFAFETHVYLYGKGADDLGNWHGNLVIESCADPTIDSYLFDKVPTLSSEIIDGLRRAGISSITGRIIISETLQQPGCIPSWEIEDVGWDYGAGLFGFNYRDNTYYLWPATGQTKPAVPGVHVTVYQDVDGTELLRGIDSNNITVYGREPANPKWRVTTTMSSPAEVYAGELKGQLLAAGIPVDGNDLYDVSTRLRIATHTSAKAPEILKQMMVESHNLYAEGMLRALAPYGSRKDALDKEKEILGKLGVSSNYSKINDGSGLSRGDRLQPLFISRVLEQMAKSRLAEQYTALFPRAGMEGTVKSLLEKTRLKGQFAFKSGSMGGVQCFAGYKLDAQGKPTHTVVILVNSFFCSRGEVRGAIEKFLLSTF